MTRIQPCDFLEAFKNEWNSRVEKNRHEVSDIYGDSNRWTNFMLGNEGFLASVMTRLDENKTELEYKREYYTLDALYVGGENLYRQNRTYPSELNVLIEHEQGDNVEEEMWKLIFWRSPLKVIIFYDWNEYEKTTNARREWLDRKLIKLVDMLNKANAYFSENQETNYLFIIGNRVEKDQLPNWRWASNKQIQPTSFVGG